MTRLGDTSITSHYEFRRSDREVLLDAEMRHVFIDPVTGNKKSMPDWAREGLAPWHAPASLPPGRA